MGLMAAEVIAVHLSSEHSFSKRTADRVELVAGIGVRGDAHGGVTVQHRSRVAADPHQPNLRQVHLIHTELFDALAAKGFLVDPGDLGENVTIRGIDLLQLPVGTRLTVGDAVVTLTGLRNPCWQIDEFRSGLLRQVVRPDGAGGVERLTGVMGIVCHSGVVRPGDPIITELPPPPHHPLTRV